MDGLMQPRPLTIAHILERAERLHAHKQVVTAGVERVTYAEVAEQTRCLAAALDSLGVPAGARVATFAANTRRHLELYLAVPVTKRVLHSINIRLSAEHLEYIVNGVLLVVAGMDATSFPLFLASGAIAGVGAGVQFKASIGAVVSMAAPEKRGEALATLFFIAYLGLSVPSLSIGLATRFLAPATVMTWFAGILLVLLAGVAALSRRSR